MQGGTPQGIASDFPGGVLNGFLDIFSFFLSTPGLFLANGQMEFVLCVSETPLVAAPFLLSDYAAESVSTLQER
jgi:hypothetical protein